MDMPHAFPSPIGSSRTHADGVGAVGAIVSSELSDAFIDTITSGVMIRCGAGTMGPHYIQAPAPCPARVVD